MKTLLQGNIIPDGDKFRLISGDALQALESFPNETVQLIITSPPYNIGKEYERDERMDFDEYLMWLDDIIGHLACKLLDGGSLCWQVGNYIKDGEVFPLDIFFYNYFKKRGLKLRNRIVWKFNFGYNAKVRLSGRYETLLWFTKGDSYTFNLDPVRVPQLYPGKRHSNIKGDKAGKPSGNPKGKNPSDYWEFSPNSCFVEDPIWDLPNIKANHPEKTIHPCQFPVELAERCILAFTNKNDMVLDPFVGTGSSIIAALKHDRLGVGIDKNNMYIDLAKNRINEFRNNKLKLRPSGMPVRRPNNKEKVAQIPDEWSAK